MVALCGEHLYNDFCNGDNSVSDFRMIADGIIYENKC